MAEITLKQYFKYLHSNKGQSMVEYTFILGFIALIVVLSLTQLGAALEIKITEFADIINP